MATVSIEHKKGEVNELKASLRNPAVERDPEKRREVVKRVIAYMTLGIDVSRLFMEMIMATSSNDLVIKKMVYLYICNYASTNPELSLLAINTFQKDCRDEDPMVRGLALRSFCSLRLPNIVEYLQKPIEDGLVDPSAYVRKTAALGCVKLHNLAPRLVADSSLPAKLRTALYDRDATVVANAVCALEEVEGREGPVERAVVHHLLNRMREFNEWAQVVVLGLVGRYAPADSNETFDVMNILEERLKHSNAAVVLATTKVFLNLTQDFPTVRQQVYARLRTPLVTLVHGGTVEQGYATLKHIALLVSRAPAVFAEEHKSFFLRFNEPTYVKLVKLDILTAIATARNVAEIAEEVSEYITDVDVAVSRSAVRVVGKLGALVPSAARSVADQLVSFLSVGISHVSAEAVVAMHALLRKHPSLLAPSATGAPSSLASAIGTLMRYADEPEAKVAMLWMLGEYGEQIPEAPYLLEPMIDEVGEEPSAAVRLELLASAVKLFVKRPPEMQRMLGRLLEAATTDVSYTDVHDRAMLYYRLLQYDVASAQKVLTTHPPAPERFVEDTASEWQDRLFEEFNSLTVIYGLPAERFLKPTLSANHAAHEETGVGLATGGAGGGARGAANGTGGGEEEEEEEGEEEEEEEEDEDEEEEEEEEEEEDEAQPGGASAGAAVAAPPGASGGGGSLVDLLGDLDLGGGAPPPPPQPAAAPPPLALSPAVSLDSASFQQQWGMLPEGGSFTMSFAGAPTPQPVVSALAARHVMCMAFGTVGQTHKFYFYAHAAAEGAVVLAELLLDLGTHTGRATLKSAAPAVIPRFGDALREYVSAAVQ